MMEEHLKMSSLWLRRACGAFALSLTFLLPMAAAQAGTLGGVAGTVTDAKTGAPLAGAQVRLSSDSQTVNVTTDSRGHYIVFSLQPDSYTITATKSGYDAVSITGETVEADQTQQYNVQLPPSAGSSQTP